MIRYLCNMIAYFLFWLVGGANNQIRDATSSFEHVSDPSAVHHAGSNPQHEAIKEDVELNNQSNKCVHPDENDRTEESIVQVTSHNKNDTKEEIHNSDTIKNNKTKDSKDANIDNSHNDHGDINLLDTAPSASYAAYFAECDKMAEENKVNSFTSDDGESIQGYDAILESPPLPEPGIEQEGFQLPEFPALGDPERTADVQPALEKGRMTRVCTDCSRWEERPDDEYEKEGLVSDEWCMLGKVVLFRKRKSFSAQCSECGFGMERVGRGKRIHRAKKFFCKIGGRVRMDAGERRNERLPGCM